MNNGLLTFSIDMQILMSDLGEGNAGIIQLIHDQI